MRITPGNQRFPRPGPRRTPFAALQLRWAREKTWSKSAREIAPSRQLFPEGIRLTEGTGLSEEEAEWLQRILDSPVPPHYKSVPAEIAARLLARGLVRKIGVMLVVTYAGISAIVAYRRSAE